MCLGVRFVAIAVTIRLHITRPIVARARAAPATASSPPPTPTFVTVDRQFIAECLVDLVLIELADFARDLVAV